MLHKHHVAWVEDGGYLVSGEPNPRDHHWLAVGDGLWLFDPTAEQFRSRGPPGLARYVVHDGRSFLVWREAQEYRS